MVVSKEKFYFLSWELISSINNSSDVTQGNEVVEITIRDIDGYRPLGHYTIPIVQIGQPFTSLKLNLLYQKDLVIETFKNIYVSIRIFRGIEQRLIFTNDTILSAPCYMDRTVIRIPIHRVWYVEDYLRMLLSNLFL
ncbi:hypothetical protein I4U23_008097 [Adineta vaga]|nr:hypothetical protein I4U23_008097 [Adineta vaga]